MTNTDPTGRAGRRLTPICVYDLGGEPRDDLTKITTPEQRFIMVTDLSARMWELSGQRRPQYRRSEMPVRVTTSA